MAWGIGVVLALAVCLSATFIGFDRDRAFYPTLLIVPAALATHGLFDFIHGRLISHPGVPVWWPSFCLTYDIVAAGYLAFLLKGSRVAAHALS